MKTKAIVAAAGLAFASTALAGPASAHVTADKEEVPAGGFTAVTLTVPHGCEDSPTTALDIQIPESILDVTPSVVPGWDVAVQQVALPAPIEGAHGEQVTERESVVTYTAQPGNELPDGYRQSFTLGFQAPDAEGEYLFFKTVQRCVTGETAWIEEYTGEGEEPEHPAPAVRVAPPSDESGGDATAADGEGAASAAGDDDDDVDALAVIGVTLGALALVVGIAALLRTRRAGTA